MKIKGRPIRSVVPWKEDPLSTIELTPQGLTEQLSEKELILLHYEVNKYMHPEPSAKEVIKNNLCDTCQDVCKQGFKVENCINYKSVCSCEKKECSCEELAEKNLLAGNRKICVRCGLLVPECKVCINYNCKPESKIEIELLERNVTANIEGVDLQLSLQIMKDKINQIIAHLNRTGRE